MAHSQHIIKPLDGQRGVVAVLFALCLIVLLGVAALAIDVARINLTKVELQGAADAAALAGPDGPAFLEPRPDSAVGKRRHDRFRRRP